MTVSSASKYLQDQLGSIYEAGEAAAISSLVLRHITGLEKTERTVSREEVMTTLQLADLEKILARLLTHEPVQYVLNESWFCGLRFSVNPHVLIPRPETEELVEWIISNCRFPISRLSILDIGTGSGCIAVTMKRRIRKADVWAVDISPGAIETAAANAVSLGTNVSFRQIDILDKTQWDALPFFHIIISNPPYIPESDARLMDKNVTYWEPGAALFVPDKDPLVFYDAISELAKTKLHNGGSLYFEMHEDRAGEVNDLLEKKGFRTAIRADMQGKQRMIKAE